MGRNGDGPSYLRLVETIRAGLPDAVIRSTFLVGFPGETEEDFALLLDFQERARFDWLGVFTWSREEGTAAYSMKGRVNKKIAAHRKTVIEERQVPITEEKMNRFVGRTVDVLVEEKFSDTPYMAPAAPHIREAPPGLWLGRLFCQAPEVDGAAVIRQAAGTTPQPGAMIRGRVCGRAGFDLEVEV
jgi:ribosomal protein S12 methylthiotransferase